MVTWHQRRLSGVLSERDDRGHPDLQVLSVYRDLGVVPKADRSDNYNKTPEDLTSYKRVRVGDVVINKMKAWSGSIALSDFDGIVSGDYMVCEITAPVEPRFLHHLLRAKPVVSQIASVSTGIRPGQWRLYWDDLHDVKIALPPLGEQRAIAEYLDTQMRTLSDLSAAIERRASVIQERMMSALSLTLGSSGEGVRLKHLALANEVSLSEDTPPDTRFRYVDISSVDSWGRIMPTGEVTFEASPSRARRLARPGDIVISTVRTYLRAIAQVAAPAEDLVFSTGFAVLSPRPSVEPRYLRWALQSNVFLDEVVARSVGINYPSINVDDLMDIRVAAPTQDKQVEIANRFDRLSGAVRGVAESTEGELAVLAERRQALITAAVTGQIEITGVAA